MESDEVRIEAAVVDADGRRSVPRCGLSHSNSAFDFLDLRLNRFVGLTDLLDLIQTYL